jgi:hypothetical protein
VRQEQLFAVHPLSDAFEIAGERSICVRRALLGPVAGRRGGRRDGFRFRLRGGDGPVPTAKRRFRAFGVGRRLAAPSVHPRLLPDRASRPLDPYGSRGALLVVKRRNSGRPKSEPDGTGAQRFGGATLRLNTYSTETALPW